MASTLKVVYDGIIMGLYSLQGFRVRGHTRGPQHLLWKNGWHRIPDDLSVGPTVLGFCIGLDKMFWNHTPPGTSVAQ